MARLKNNGNRVAPISTSLILIGVLKGYIERPVLFLIQAKITFKKFRRTADTDLPDDLMDTTGLIAWLYIQLKQEIEQKKAFEIVRAVLLTSGLAVQQANFRNVEEARTFKNLVINQKRAKEEGSTKHNTMEIIEEGDSKYHFHVTHCLFFELFKYFKVPELTCIMCSIDNAIFSSYLPDEVTFDRDGVNNTIPKGNKYCNFIISKNI